MWLTIQIDSRDSHSSEIDIERLDTIRSRDRLGSKKMAKIMGDAEFMSLVGSFVKSDTVIS